MIRRDLATSAAWGFLAGAIFACTVMWAYGDAVESLGARFHVTRSSGAIDRWNGAMADADPARPPGKPVATSGSIAAAARAIIKPAAPPELVARHLELPVEGVDRRDLVRSFDDRRTGSRPHEAIDIPAPRSTPVRAVDGGTIARLFNSQAGGITVYQFDPDQRYCYYYAHLERYAAGLSEGAQVRRGQTLGYVGTSGNAPKNVPHLHFAVFRLNPDHHWWEGTPIDPYDLLR